MWKCAICEQIFADIPDGAVELAARRRSRRSYLYRFSNGAIHDLRVVAKAEPALEQEVVQVLETLPEPEIIAEKVAAEIEPEVEEPMTAMAAAFRRIKS
jgi:hypothetical protein